MDSQVNISEATTQDGVSGYGPDGASVPALLDIGPDTEMAGDQTAVDASHFLSLEASPLFVEKIPIQFARRHGVLGLAGDDESHLVVATADLECLDELDVLARFLRVSVELQLYDEREITEAINRAYEQREGEADQLIDSFDREAVLDELNRAAAHDDLLETDSRSPVIKLVNLLIFEAIKAGASDIHLQPFEDSLMARFRIDGVLFDQFTVPKHLQEESSSRVKIIGGMNIAEKRLPQDGRATVNVGEREIDLRISSVPTSLGERIVIRLLDKSARLYTLEEIGMSPRKLERFRDLIRLEHGLLLLTGPTGSGKSTTLYAGLKEIDSKQRNVITIEDPIEYQLPGVSQIQVHAKKGMTFASGLRSVLRQDPDIIMVGEIRDSETAIMAIQSALTGHLVCSTLHTNDAASAVTRLLDLGIEPYLAASSVIGVMAQRLVRRVCPKCAVPHEPPPEEWRKLNIDISSIDLSGVRIGSGCEYCRDTGYRGRVGLFELLIADESIRNHVQRRDPASVIKQTAMQSGMTTLRDDGVEKILAGVTTIDEIVRVTMREEPDPSPQK